MSRCGDGDGEGNQIDVIALTSALVDLANAASAVIRSVFESGDLRVVDKDKVSTSELSAAASAPEARLAHVIKRSSSGVAQRVGDPQTIADVQSQKLIVGSLRNVFPRLTVVGEEGDLSYEQEDTIIPRLNLLDASPLVTAADASQPHPLRSVDVNDVVVWIGEGGVEPCVRNGGKLRRCHIILDIYMVYVRACVCA